MDANRRASEARVGDVGAVPWITFACIGVYSRLIWTVTADDADDADKAGIEDGGWKMVDRGWKIVGTFPSFHSLQLAFISVH